MFIFCVHSFKIILCALELRNLHACRSVQQIQNGQQKWGLLMCFCVNVIAVLSKAQLLMSEIEKELDSCTLAGPSTHRRCRTVRIKARVRIPGQTSWNHMTTIFTLTKQFYLFYYNFTTLWELRWSCGSMRFVMFSSVYFLSLFFPPLTLQLLCYGPTREVYLFNLFHPVFKAHNEADRTITFTQY